MRILITGGAGFVGANLAVAFAKSSPSSQVAVLDNLRRRGSELNLQRLKQHGVEFFHGDIRNPSDLTDLPGTYDLLIEASAEPSVHAGTTGSPEYVIDTNLRGTIHCLEFVRKRVDSLVFLSTSRVYSIEPLRKVRLIDGATRYEIDVVQDLPGVSLEGIDETFATHLPRSFYGATKLASELLIQEYAATYGVKAVINRCGVIAGPGQFGKVDQGVYTWWVAAHHFGKSLRYTGFGGTGKQVRDLLHPDDLFRLIAKQIEVIASISGEIYNVGGGRGISVSLQELTELCREATGAEVPIEGAPETSPVDIPLYITDGVKVTGALDWRPRVAPDQIVQQIAQWIRENETELRPIFS